MREALAGDPYAETFRIPAPGMAAIVSVASSDFQCRPLLTRSTSLWMGRANLSCWASLAPLVYPPTMFHCSRRREMPPRVNGKGIFLKIQDGFSLLRACMHGLTCLPATSHDAGLDRRHLVHHRSMMG
jgi:hypothetical protein